MKRLRWVTAGMAAVLLACGGLEAGEGAPPSSPEALAVAAALGLPPVTPGMDAAGPFVGPEATIYYLARDGRVSFFNPQTFTAYMAELDPERFTYIMAPQGFFAVSGDTVTPLDGPPPDISRWPLADPLAVVIIAHLEEARRQRQRQPGQDAATWQALSEMSRMQHETSMAIIDNMGSSGCIDHYEGPTYIGCW